MFKRTLENVVKKKIGKRKAIIITGARQVGKTTLIKKILTQKDYLFLNGDDPTVRAILLEPDTAKIKSILGKNKIVFIDEAQRINNIGLTLKIIVDIFSDVQLFVTGSSSFDLGNQLNEPLTGRKWEYVLFPISWEEYENKIGFLESERQLENRLIYGFYPDVLNNPGEEKEILKNLTDSYLFRDIFNLTEIRRSDSLEKLLQALALQVGNEVNYTELAQISGINKNTVLRYIQILEKGYVIFRLKSYGGNLRNEIKKSKKIYFIDNGIRNAIIGNFSPLNLRTDIGALWENFLVSERMKQNSYKQTYANIFFWRTKQQQEIDFVEEKDGVIKGFEFKWSVTKKVRIPKTFTENYKTNVKIINRENFREFVII